VLLFPHKKSGGTKNKGQKNPTLFCSSFLLTLSTWKDWNSWFCMGKINTLLTSLSFFKEIFWFPKSRSLKPWVQMRSLWRTWYGKGNCYLPLDPTQKKGLNDSVFRAGFFWISSPHQFWEFHDFLGLEKTPFLLKGILCIWDPASTFTLRKKIACWKRGRDL